MLVVPAGAGTITIDFDSVPVDSTGFGNPSAYLAGFGITLSYTFPVSQVAQLIVGDDRFIYDTGDPTPSVVQAPSPHNIVTQGGSNGPITFTLHFSTPLESFAFTRVLAFPGAPPTSHPAWAAAAFDADDNEIASVSEGFSLNGTPATFTLSAASPSITRVTFFRDGTRGTASVNFTAFSHVLTDNWVLTGPGVGVIEVAIDITPGSFPNSINPHSRGVVPVAILTTGTFDASTVDTNTVRFGRTGTEAAAVHSALEDVDGDGDIDLILQFNTQDTGIVCGDTSASPTGQTFGGQAIEGSDSIRTVPCK